MATVTFDHVYKKYGEVTAVSDLNLEIDDGEFMVLVGPSGCGKTTSLRMIAGLEEITEGLLRIGDKVVNDVAPKDRDIAMVFQSYALYPHMTVRDNLAFGLKLRKVPKAEIEKRVNDAAGILQLEKLLDRKPKELSGGQRQRVALGRAIVREPAVFLMDEPLSNLDAKLRVQTRAEIARLHQRLGTTMVYVTHDQVEAMTMGERIAVMSDGLLQQVGTPQELYDHPDEPVRGRLHRQPVDELHRDPGRPTGGPRRSAASRSRSRTSTRSTSGRGPHGRSRASGPSTSSWASSADPSAPSRARRTSSSTSATRSSSTCTVGEPRDRRDRRTPSHRVRPGDIIELRLPAEKLHLFDTGDRRVAFAARRSPPPDCTAPPSGTAGPSIAAGRPLARHEVAMTATTTPAPGDDPLAERSSRTEVIHRGRYIEFRVDTIERADGSRGTRDIVGHPGAVAILALDATDRLLLVRQWRLAAGRALLEIPAGTLDVHDGVDRGPRRRGPRELEEETGHRAGSWRKLGDVLDRPGVRLGADAPVPGDRPDRRGDGEDRLAPDEDERLELRHVPLDEALAVAEARRDRDAKTILGLLWLDRLWQSRAS